MKRSIAQTWADLVAKAKQINQSNPSILIGILAIVGIIILGYLAFVLIQALAFPASSAQYVAPVPTMLATTTVDNTRQMQSTTEMAPTLTPIPTSTPVPSNLWVVSQLLGKQNINGYNSLVVEFKNTATGEIKKGLCQSPHDPAPVVGDIYIAEVMVDYVLLSPTIAGTSQIDLSSKVQRFIFIR